MTSEPKCCRKATTFSGPTQEDYLFGVKYEHVASNAFLNCDRSTLYPRRPRDHEEPVIRYGLIGSVNRVGKDGRRRDQLAGELGVYEPLS